MRVGERGDSGEVLLVPRGIGLGAKIEMVKVLLFLDSIFGN